MAMSAVEHELLARLHSGHLDVPRWQGFLDCLREQTDADRCQLTFRRGDAPAESVTIWAGILAPGYLIDSYGSRFASMDPVPYAQLRTGNVYSIHEFIVPGNETHQAYLHEFLIPAGLRYNRIMRIGDAYGYDAWLNVCSDTVDFGSDVDDLLNSLSRHMSIAVGNFAMMEKSLILRRIIDDAVHQLHFGWLTIDSTGHIVNIDDEAETMLRSINVAGGRGCALKMPDRSARESLQIALNTFANDPGARPRAVRLSYDPYLTMLLLPMRTKPLSGSRSEIVIAYLQGDAGLDDHHIEPLMDLFGLTHSEARLALAIAQGKSLQESANHLGLTVETVRSYSKRIYSKTGVRGQSELIKLLLGSVAMLIPHRQQAESVDSVPVARTHVYFSSHG